MKKNYLSIDIGGTNIKYGLLNHAGQLISHGSKRTPNISLAKFTEAVTEIIRDNIDHIRGIAISAPGKVDPKAGVIYHGGSLPFLDHVNFKEQFESLYHVPVSVENDGKAAALAEMWLGSLKNIRQGAVIVLGTGIGGGLVLDGKIFRGFRSQAGEFSFMDLSQRTNSTATMAGFAGSAVGLIKACAQRLNLENLHDGLTVFSYLNDGDDRVMPLFRDYCDVIATMILNIQSVVDIQRIAISGGISAQPLVLKGIQQAYDAIRERVPLIKSQLEAVELVEARFKNDANLYGALYSLLLSIDEQV